MIDVAAPARRILDAVVQHFEDNDWDLPPRRYIAAGQVTALAADDEHLCIALSGLRRGASENSRDSGARTPAKGAGAAPLARAEYLLRLLRCVATVDDDGHPPTSAQLHADGLRLLEDPGHLLDALYVWAAGEPHNLTVDFGPVEPVGPEGGLAGHVVRVVFAPAQAYPVGGP